MDYEDIGVDIQGSSRIIEGLEEMIKSTYDGNVLSKTGFFGGIYRLGNLAIAISINRIGTKLIIAKEMGSLEAMEMMGKDLVNHSINDILCTGAIPRFFLNYIAQDRLRGQEIESLIKGMVFVCSEADVSLIGGEIAQMSDIYREEMLDLVGVMVGITRVNKIIEGPKAIRPGDQIIGLPSLGLHTNGYSFVKNIFFEKRRCSLAYPVKMFGGTGTGSSPIKAP